MLSTRSASLSSSGSTPCNTLASAMDPSLLTTKVVTTVPCNFLCFAGRGYCKLSVSHLMNCTIPPGNSGYCWTIRSTTSLLSASTMSGLASVVGVGWACSVSTTGISSSPAFDNASSIGFSSVVTVSTGLMRTAGTSGCVIATTMSRGSMAGTISMSDAISSKASSPTATSSSDEWNSMAATNNANASTIPMRNAVGRWCSSEAAVDFFTSIYPGDKQLF